MLSVSSKSFTSSDVAISLFHFILMLPSLYFHFILMLPFLYLHCCHLFFFLFFCIVINISTTSCLCLLHVETTSMGSQLLIIIIRSNYLLILEWKINVENTSLCFIPGSITLLGHHHLCLPDIVFHHSCSAYEEAHM